MLDAIRGFVREAEDESLTARTALLGGAVAASGRTPDHVAVVELQRPELTEAPRIRPLDHPASASNFTPGARLYAADDSSAPLGHDQIRAESPEA